jgi:hypothetical protein
MTRRAIASSSSGRIRGIIAGGAVARVLELVPHRASRPEPKFAGKVEIRMEHPHAAAIAGDLNARIAADR